MKHDDSTQGPISGTQRNEPPSSDGTTPPRGKGFREPLGDDAVEQLRQYQVITLPPSARRALLGAQLPGASPDLLYDTLPPNLALAPGDAEPLVQGESSTLVPSRQGERRAVVVAIAIVLIALAALMVTLLVVHSRRQPSADTPAANKSPAPATAPRPAAALQPAPVVQQAPRDRTPREKAAVTPEKSATGARRQPTKQPSVTASATTPRSAPRSTSADAVSVPAPAPSADTGKKFRLGSR